MRSASSVAISSNEKIFPIFAKKLTSSDPAEFVHIAHKLAVWLCSEKAYYPAARPKIVQLLEIARQNFINVFMNHPSAAEPAEYLRRLIQAVTPYRRLFPENDLQSRLQRVISDINLSLSVMSQSNTQTSGVVAGSPTVPVQPPPTMPIAPGTMLQTQLQGVVRAVPDGPAHTNPPLVSDLTQAASTVPPTTDSHQDSGDISPSMAFKSQPKRTRRAELSEELIARDLDWFKSQQESTTVNEDPNISSFKAEASSPVSASDTFLVTHSSSLLRQKTARMVPSRRLPRRVSTGAALDAETNVSELSVPHASEPSGEQAVPVENAEDRSARMNVDEPNRPLESMDLDVRSVEMSDPPSAILPQTTLESLEPEPVDIPGEHSDFKSFVSELPRKVEPTSPLADLSPVLQLRNPVLPPFDSPSEPPLDLDFRLPPIPIAADANQSRFDGKMTVIHSIQGKSFTHTHVIDIRLDEGMYGKISKWADRKSRPIEAAQGVCLSLACYRLPVLFSTVKVESGTPDIQALMLRSSCAWPDATKRLSLHVDHEGKEITIPLSPPLFLTSDQCVDISRRMKPGNNTLQIRQTEDLSEYLLVLHAHRPTQTQLAEFEVVHMADERWRRFLGVLCAHAAPRKNMSGLTVF